MMSRSSLNWCHEMHEERMRDVTLKARKKRETEMTCLNCSISCRHFHSRSPRCINSYSLMMTLKGVSLFFFFVLVKRTIGEDMRSVRMSLFNGSTFQCAQTTCLPFANLTTANVRRCQIACLMQVPCEAATYYQPASSCQLYNSSINQNGNLSYHMNAMTMMVIAGTRFPPGQSFIE